MDKFAPCIEYINETPVNFRKIVKKISANGVWEERVFYQTILSEKEKSKVQVWLTDHYGNSSYGANWWSTSSTIVMNDEIYTHWKLCE